MIKTLMISLVAFNLSYACIAQDYMDEIAQKACQCVEEMPNNSDEDPTMGIGLCIIDATKDHKENLKADYQIDFDNIDVQGEELGRIIGIRMATICPKTIMMLAGEVEDTDTTEEEGEVTHVMDDGFVIFTIKNSEGKTSRFFWLSFVAADFELQSTYQELVGKKVKVGYSNQELFDPKILEYRNFNIITSIEVISP